MKENVLKGKDLGEPRVNEEIKVSEVRLILENGEQAGIVSIKEALMAAEEAGLDLVEVANNANPPVCKIMDYGKYKYEQLKKQKMGKKKQHKIQMKEIKLSPRIDPHDLEVKIKHAKKFLEDNDRVKFNMFFKGREIAYVEHGKAILMNVIKQLEDIAGVEQEPKLEGNRYIMVMIPKKKKV